ncbi:hypothetical protein ElyMa_001351200 [Elysia marginata]|uniref:Uncharacterized protein n=1 Tax=Elysia marginata TaxID=1093978 RepID=A0AAV4IPJ4_9GAST|nr:hypothetical protein ElyMa_001351200 [Elysia marginata]
MERLRVLTAALSSRATGKPPPVNKSPIEGQPPGLLCARNFRYEDSPHPSAYLRVQGLTYESYDIHWHPKITSIMTATMLSRFHAQFTPLPASSNDKEGIREKTYFMDWPILTDKYFTFVSSTEFVMSRAMYDNNLCKSPVDMKLSLGYIGNSSLAVVNDFYACSDVQKPSAPLWTNTVQLVAVDKTTRKPAKLPDWYQSKYKGRGCRSKGLIIRAFERPAVTYAHPSVVQYSECGNYKHATWVAYVGWAIDALHAALLLQNSTVLTSYSSYSHAATPGDSPNVRARAALKGISKDIVARGLHKLHLIFLNECLQGEYVETHLWQEDGEEKELVYFSVVKDGKDMCQMKMWFFNDASSQEGKHL